MSGNTKGKVIAMAAGVVLPLAIFLYVILEPVPSESRGAASAGTSPATPDSLALLFLTGPDQVVHIVDVAGADTLRSMASGEGGFLRGVLRPLERERARREIPLSTPYHLVRLGSGELLLKDPGSDLTVDVAAFGATSTALFNALLSGDAPPEVPPLINNPSSMEDRP